MVMTAALCFHEPTLADNTSCADLVQCRKRQGFMLHRTWDKALGDAAAARQNVLAG